MTPQLKNEELTALIYRTMEAMDDDDDNKPLEDAMYYFCSMWDIREGLKHAIRLCLDDQMNNHASEVETNDLEKLLSILENK